MPNLKDGNILLDFSVFVAGIGKIGVCPSFQPPEINVAVEEFRGGGMDGTVEVPMGFEKIEFDFDLHVWDPQVHQQLGYGPGRQDVEIQFNGYLLSPIGGEQPMNITCLGFVRNIKPGKVEAGKKSEVNIAFSAHTYSEVIAGLPTVHIDLYNKIYMINGQDLMAGARGILGITGGDLSGTGL